MSPKPQLEPRKLTWSVLIGRWVDFARSALALPDHEEGRRLKDSVPDIIMLQAVWFALQHLDELGPDERALGLDRAELLIETHSRHLHARWHESSMPSMLSEIMNDARCQFEVVAGRH